MSRSHHIAKITSGAAIEHVRSYLLSEAARLGLGEEVDAADCRKLLALLQDMRRSLETLERRGGLVVVSSTQTLITVSYTHLDHGEDLDPAVGVVDDEFRPKSGLLPVGLSREEGRAEVRLKTGVRRHAGGKAGRNGHGLVHARILAAAAPVTTPRCACGAGPGLRIRAVCRSRPRREAKSGE